MNNSRLEIEDRNESLKVCISKDIVVRYRLEGIDAAGIYKLRLWILLIFGKHQDVDRYRSAIKQIGSKRYDCLHKVMIYQILTNLLLCTAPIKNTEEANNTGLAFAGKITQSL